MNICFCCRPKHINITKKIMSTCLSLSLFPPVCETVSLSTCLSFYLSVYLSASTHLLELLWTAPELLRKPIRGGSFAGDVFSFSIIIQEVISRTLPYAMMDMPAHGETGPPPVCLSDELSVCLSVSQRFWSV